MRKEENYVYHFFKSLFWAWVCALRIKPKWQYFLTNTYVVSAHYQNIFLLTRSHTMTPLDAPGKQAF